MELPSSFLNAFTLHPGSTTITESGRQSSSAPRARMASMRRSACARVMAVIGPPVYRGRCRGVLNTMGRRACRAWLTRDGGLCPPSARSARALDPRRLRMTEFSRRDMLGAAAAGGMVAAATSTETFGQGQPPFGPTPAPLAGAELPSFRFRLGPVAPKTWDGGWANEATVVDFPVSQAIAGVLMSLVPGGLRELHWHANAAEWAYVIKGQCRVTTINPQGQSQVVDFHAGDVWYFPRGFGHSIQGIGSEDCLFVLVFDNGYFSEFGTFSITDWVGHTPPEVLAKYFGVPASTFGNFPKREVYTDRGRVPPPLPANPGPGTLDSGPLTHRYRLLAQRPDTYPGGTNRLVSQRQFPISTTVTGALMQIKPGGVRVARPRPHRRVQRRRRRLRAAGHAFSVSSTRSGVNGRWRSRLPGSR